MFVLRSVVAVIAANKLNFAMELGMECWKNLKKKKNRSKHFDLTLTHPPEIIKYSNMAAALI